ncbi:MAG: hypothetical protein R3B06_13130 [Kofleriaceae bacterium]
MTRAAAGLALIAAVAAGGVRAEPRVDPDAEREARGGFWENVTDPGAQARRALLRDAVRVLRLPSTSELPQVQAGLAQLTVDAPASTDAWGYRAVIAERQRDWATCGASYRRVVELDPAWLPTALVEGRTSARDPLRRPALLGAVLCLSRDGQLAAARGLLEAAIARGDTSSQLWLRAGEIAMAQGRLDDAVAALAASGEAAAPWLLAMALDRARQDDRAAAAAAQANQRDPFATRTSSAAVPMVPPADADYLLGFAARSRDDAAYAQVYFRRYLIGAPADAPWRARAGEHLAAVATSGLAAGLTIQGGDADPARRAQLAAAITRAEGRLRACVAAVPTGLAELRITTIGAAVRKPDPRGRRRTPVPAAPAPTATFDAYYLVAPLPPPGGPDVRDQALRCLEQVGAELGLPVASGPAWSTVRLPVLAR